MGFKLPELTTDVDCEPLGYPGLVFRFWLNATNPVEEWIAPSEREPPVQEPEPWDRLWYVGLARVLQCVIIPGAYTDSGEEEAIETPDAKAVYELERMPGFEQMTLHWAFNVLGEERQERLAAERKN